MSATSDDNIMHVYLSMKSLAVAVLKYLKKEGIVLNDKAVVGDSTEQYKKAPRDLHWFFSKDGKAPPVPMESYLNRLFCYYVQLYSDNAKYSYISPKDATSDLEGLGSATMGGALLAVTAFTIFNLQKALKKYNNDVCTHRLFGIIFMEVIKFSEDDSYNNTSYSPMVATTSIQELNALEIYLFVNVLNCNLGYNEKKQPGDNGTQITVDRNKGIEQIKKIANQLMELEPNLKDALVSLENNGIIKNSNKKINSSGEKNDICDEKTNNNDEKINSSNEKLNINAEKIHSSNDQILTPKTSNKSSIIQDASYHSPKLR